MININKKITKISMLLLVAVVCLAVILILVRIGSVAEARKHVCSETSRNIVSSQHLQSGQPGESVSIKSGSNYWLNGSNLDQNTDEVFGSLYFTSLHYIPEGQEPHISYNAKTKLYSSTDPKIDLNKSENWYKLDVAPGKWRFYIADRKDNTANIKLVACPKKSFVEELW